VSCGGSVYNRDNWTFVVPGGNQWLLFVAHHWQSLWCATNSNLVKIFLGDFCSTENDPADCGQGESDGVASPGSQILLSDSFEGFGNEWFVDFANHGTHGRKHFCEALAPQCRHARSSTFRNTRISSELSNHRCPIASLPCIHQRIQETYRIVRQPAKTIPGPPAGR